MTQVLTLVPPEPAPAQPDTGTAAAPAPRQQLGEQLAAALQTQPARQHRSRP